MSTTRARRRAGSGSGGASAAVPAAAALASGMLASSCCVLQLALNAMSIGCAGFSALTPYRPLFRAMTGVSLAALAARQGLTDRRTLATGALALALAASSDVLASVNRSSGGDGSSSFFSSSAQLGRLLLPPLVAAPLRRALQPLLESLPPSNSLRACLDAALSPGGEGAVAPLSATSSSSPPPQKIALKVRGIRCEACASRVRGALQRQQGVLNATVDVDRGVAEVFYQGLQEGDEGRERLVAAVEGLKAGYEVVGQEEEEKED